MRAINRVISSRLAGSGRRSVAVLCRRCFRRPSTKPGRSKGRRTGMALAVSDGREAAMQERSVVQRVEILEQRVETFAALPDRVHAVELQIVHLRGEMRDGFSALGAELRGDFQAGIDAAKREPREEIHAGNEHVKSELRAEIRAGDDETRRYMPVLHEEVISRLATLGEGRRCRRKTS